jgi:hypothetical protein
MFLGWWVLGWMDVKAILRIAGLKGKLVEEIKLTLGNAECSQ